MWLYGEEQHRSKRGRCALALPALMLVFLFFLGCGKTPLPIDRLKQELSSLKNYTILLHDMKEEGGFFKEFFHKYRIVTDQREWTTEWLRVPEKYYRRMEPFLGMALVTKKEGKLVEGQPRPPGYAYVGDTRYGRWRHDNQGNSFWEFYGKYALLSHLLGMGTRPVYYRDYETYREYRSRRRPYFGPHREYGTNGSWTRKQNPNFFARRLERQRLKRASFKDKVARRIGRTRTSFRGRGGGWGK